MHIFSVVDEFFLLKWSVRTRVRLSGLVLLTLLPVGFGIGLLIMF